MVWWKRDGKARQPEEPPARAAALPGMQRPCRGGD